MVCAIRTGATRDATELMVMAATAIITWGFSPATSGANSLIPLRSDAGWRGPRPDSSVYFRVAGAALGVEELDIFGRCLHQLLVRSGGQDLSLHQNNDLVVIHHGGDLLRDGDERDSRIILADVLENRLFRARIDARREIVEEQHLRIQRESAG